MQWDSKRKLHVQYLPKQGYLSKTRWNLYWNLKEVKSDSQDMKIAHKFAKSCLEKLENDDFKDIVAKKSFLLLVVVIKHIL